MNQTLLGRSLRSVSLICFALASLACDGCGEKNASAPAPVPVPVAVAADPEPVAAAPVEPPEPAPADPNAALARDVADKYWKALATTDVAAVRSLTGGDIGAQFDKLQKELGETGLQNKMRAGAPMKTVGYGKKKSDDEYEVRCKTTAGPSFSVILTVKKSGGQWKVAKLRPEQLPK